MSTVDKAKLRQLAEQQAWTGRWYDAGCETVSCDYNGEYGDHMHGEVAHPEPTGAAAFISAANPATLLSLLDEIEALRVMAGQAYQVLGALDAPHNILDQVSAAASGEPLPHATILPFFSGDYEALRKDAELYRALRAMHWHDSPLAVVRNPKDSVLLGSECPSGERLDEAIMEATPGAAPLEQPAT